jgi:hypothetical protein
MKKEYVETLYANVDRMNSRAIADNMTEDGIFRFANMPPVEGRENIYNFLEGFFKSIKAIEHNGLECWFTDKHWFVIGNVKYTRLDHTELSVPFSVTLRMESDKIKEYLIFIDNHELYN